MFVDVGLGLAAGVANLCPKMVAVPCASLSPASQCCLHLIIWHAINDHVARSLEVISIDLYVAR